MSTATPTPHPARPGPACLLCRAASPRASGTRPVAKPDPPPPPSPSPASRKLGLPGSDSSLVLSSLGLSGVPPRPGGRPCPHPAPVPPSHSTLYLPRTCSASPAAARAQQPLGAHFQTVMRLQAQWFLALSWRPGLGLRWGVGPSVWSPPRPPRAGVKGSRVTGRQKAPPPGPREGWNVPPLPSAGGTLIPPDGTGFRAEPAPPASADT